jgi:hypothetical protein
MAALQLRPASADAVVAFYSLIHVPVTDQRDSFAHPPLAPPRRLLPGDRRSKAADPQCAVPPVLTCSGTTPTLPPTVLAAGNATDARVEPLHPRRRQRPYPRTCRGAVTYQRAAASYQRTSVTGDLSQRRPAIRRPEGLVGGCLQDCPMGRSSSLGIAQ